jgi:hypothetical protein
VAGSRPGFSRCCASRGSWRRSATRSRRDKEPHRALLTRIPISVVLRVETPLLGAAHLAEAARA